MMLHRTAAKCECLIILFLSSCARTTLSIQFVSPLPHCNIIFLSYSYVGNEILWILPESTIRYHEVFFAQKIVHLINSLYTFVALNTHTTHRHIIGYSDRSTMTIYEKLNTDLLSITPNNDVCDYCVCTYYLAVLSILRIKSDSVYSCSDAYYYKL